MRVNGEQDVSQSRSNERFDLSEDVETLYAIWVTADSMLSQGTLNWLMHMMLMVEVKGF